MNFSQRKILKCKVEIEKLQVIGTNLLDLGDAVLTYDVFMRCLAGLASV